MHHHRYSLYEEIHVTPNRIPLVDRQDDRTSNILPEEKIRVIVLVKLPAYHYWFHLDVCPCWRYSVCVCLFAFHCPFQIFCSLVGWHGIIPAGFFFQRDFPALRQQAVSTMVGNRQPSISLLIHVLNNSAEHPFPLHSRVEKSKIIVKRQEYYARWHEKTFIFSDLHAVSHPVRVQSSLIDS